MNNRENFRTIMDFQPREHMPAWYFGLWDETRTRWAGEAGGALTDLPALTGMDPDWEDGLWNVHGLTRIGPISGRQEEVVREEDDYRLVRTSLGAIHRRSKKGSSIPQHVEEALKPNRESWRVFKRFLDPSDRARVVEGWEAGAARQNRRERMTGVLGGSLFGWPREWLGIEAISCLAYDDPALYEEIIESVADHFMTILRPILEKTQFDFVYFFEDCCFNTGPLFSPDTYRKFYHKYYRKMVDFYHGLGVRYVLLDSDGKVDDLIPCWLESGIDIVFPIEVGTWKASPAELRRKFGSGLRMMGGVDKHVIPKGEAAIREHLETLRPAVEQGGFLPIPDHRIPPDCSLEQFRQYVRVFRSVFGN